jgi:16S rRNA (cytidine1402-2'-O)-methyltransferase
MLFLVATPIGNLADLAERALATLRSSDLILCEDTRHSQILLRHHGIEKPLLSFHQFNEKEREERVLSKLKEDQTISLLSDAGTPLISDPGLWLVQACIRENLPFSVIPGPCSPIQALALSGFETSRFQFIGFLPRDAGPLKEKLLAALFYRGTTIAFESAQRIIASLEAIEKICPERELAIARELTKTYEECRRGTASDLLAHFRENKPRGEIVLLLREGQPPEEEIGIVEMVELLQELHGLTSKEAIKAAAKLKDLPKSEVYRLCHYK